MYITLGTVVHGEGEGLCFFFFLLNKAIAPNEKKMKIPCLGADEKTGFESVPSKILSVSLDRFFFAPQIGLGIDQ